MKKKLITIVSFILALCMFVAMGCEPSTKIDLENAYESTSNVRIKTEITTKITYTDIELDEPNEEFNILATVEDEFEDSELTVLTILEIDDNKVYIQMQDSEGKMIPFAYYEVDGEDTYLYSKDIEDNWTRELDNDSGFDLNSILPGNYSESDFEKSGKYYKLTDEAITAGGYDKEEFELKIKFSNGRFSEIIVKQVQTKENGIKLVTTETTTKLTFSKYGKIKITLPTIEEPAELTDPN